MFFPKFKNFLISCHLKQIGYKKKKIRFSYPQGNFPRLCLIGNSNVGKSSLTRLLLSHPKEYKSKIGKIPGSTIRLTIINDKNLNYHVIDLPGFGSMTRLSKKDQIFIQEQILKYVELDKKNIFLMLLVVSADRLDDELEKWYFQSKNTIPLTIEFIDFLLKNDITCLMVLNKKDKLNIYKRKELNEKLAIVFEDFQIKATGITAKKGFLGIIETSAKKEEGIKELKKIIRKHSNRINLSNFDSRNDLMDLPSINKVKRNK